MTTRLSPARVWYPLFFALGAHALGCNSDGSQGSGTAGAGGQGSPGGGGGATNTGGVAPNGSGGGMPRPLGNPPPNNLPGVQVDPGTGVVSCVPLCKQTLDASQDPQMDDWGWESNSSCIIPNTATATNDACVTGMPLPPKTPRPGVVVRNAAGERECVAKCVFYTSSTQPGANGDGFADDWAYENNATCVIASTVTAATSTSCTTGMPVPPDAPRPGVVVRNSTTQQLECVAVCTYFTSATQRGADSDNLGDDWAYEFSASCIIPGTVTSFNQACTTQMPLPPVQPRPGIMVNGDPVIDSCKSSTCVPFCQVVKAPSDPTYPDWGWENNNSCVIPNTPTATVIPKAVENHGYAVPPRKCMWGETPPNTLAPPALNATRNVRGHFQTVGAQLRDPYDQPFVIRGVNNSHGWYDICGQYSAFEALDNIALTGANAVRVGWAFKSIDPVGPTEGDPEKPVIGTTPQLLAEILYRIVQLQMVPILAVNDSTGQTTVDWPLRMAQLMTAPGFKEVLVAYDPYLLLGIANEWNGTDFYNGYNMAVQHLRTNGINATLVVTANDWGQGCDAILNNAGRLTTADPRTNILYDIHIYNYLTYQAGHGGTAAIVQGCMDSAATAGIPLLVGEFGHTHGGMPVQWQTVIARANANNQGYTPWLWYGDTEFPELDLASSWEGPLTAWGNNVLPLNGRKATIFQ